MVADRLFVIGAHPAFGRRSLRGIVADRASDSPDAAMVECRGNAWVIDADSVE